MRLRIALVILLAISCILSHGQNYSYEKLIHTSDSILRSKVSPYLLQYFKRDSSSIKYEYKNVGWKKWKTRYAQVKQHELTEGAFQGTFVFYHFYFKEPMVKGAWYQGFLANYLDVILNSKLELIDTLDLSFIPNYVKEKRACDFISLEKAMELAEKNEIKKGIERVEATLDYETYWGTYCWNVQSVLTKEIHNGHFHGDADTVVIDAVTQRILFHGTMQVGAVH